MADRVDLSKLLEHAQWVRALATSLARGDEDDAVQELWVAALRSPPDDDRAPKPWLAKVLRNAARKRFRDETTRQRNEAAVPVEAEPSTPEDVVGRAEVHRLLVDATLELEEPFRQTVLLRFFDGLTSEEIAHRLSVPAGTVRWRLKEGLDRLRARLDERHQGDRRQWVLAVAPLVLPPAGPWLTAGVALMEKKTRIALLIAAGIAVSLVSGWSLGWGSGGLRRDVDAGVVISRITSADQVINRPASIDAGSPVVVPDILGQMVPLPPPVDVPTTNATGAPTSPVGPGVAAVPPTSTDAGTRFAIDKDGIRAAIRSAMPEIRDCYDGWLKLHPELGGKLVVTLTIDTDDGVEGRISRIGQLDGGLGHPTMEGCVLASLSDLRFDPPLAGPINVTYPLMFSSDGGR